MVSKTDDIPASVPVDLAREGETANSKDSSKETALKDPCACGM